jgi:hypothetical protein
MRQRLAASVAAILMAALAAPAPARAGSPPAPLASLDFLVGDWTGGGGGTPGQAEGGTTFAPALQGRVLIRTNFAVTPATATTPSSRHDDLMVVHADDRGVVRADYYDNEGHVIRYTVTSPQAGQVVFTSEATAEGPQFRLTYETGAAGVVKGTFAFAPPGKPGAFTPYLKWEMTRRPAAAKRS